MYIKCLHGDLASSPNVSLHGDVGGSVEGSLCKDPTIPTKIESVPVPGSCYFFKRCLQRGSDESFVRISWDFPTMLLPYVRGPLPVVLPKTSLKVLRMPSLSNLAIGNSIIYRYIDHVPTKSIKLNI